MVPEPLSRPRREADRPSIPGYRIEDVIGRGAAGVVYRARQLAVDREVALKVLHPELSKNERIVQRLQREARTTARLAHPHIVSAIDMGVTDGRWWYAMELVDGPSLALILRQEGRLKEREALRLFIPLCEALEHAWEHGVVHRDIKPANILIDRVTGARLADLGLAFADDDPGLTGQGGTLGTPHFISPEQAVDPTQADIRSDIWSFGATLYNAVTGRPPFGGESTAEVLSSVLYARVPDPTRLEPALSKGLVLILRKCLTRAPKERYQSPRELLLDLERVRERRQPKVSRRGLDPLERERGRLELFALGGAALGLALLLVWWLTTTLRGEEPGGGGERVVFVPTFAPLDDLEMRVARATSGFGPLLGELEDIRGVPDEHEARLERLERDIRGRLAAEIDAVVEAINVEIDQAFHDGDFVAAREWLDEELPGRLEAETGFAMAGLEARFGRLRAEVVQMRARLGQREEQLRQDLFEALELKKLRMLGEAEGLERDRRWRDARSLLAKDRTEILFEIGYDGFRFAPEVEDELFLDLRVRLESRRLQVEDDWRLADAELVAWVDEREKVQRGRLERRELRVGAAEELREAFDRELFDRDVEVDQMPVDLAQLALEELEEASRRLDELEDGLREDEVRADFEQIEELGALNLRKREYELTQALWEGLAEDLDALPGDPRRPWRVEIRGRAETRAEEARMLHALLVGAAEALRALDGRVHELSVRGGIRERGRIEAGVDPLADGFRLVPERPPAFGLSLRTLAPSDVETLAGLEGPEAELAPSDRLLLAAFRFREGLFDKCQRALYSGDLPREDLARDLKRWLADVKQAVARRDATREEEARTFLKLLDEDRLEERIEVNPSSVLHAVEMLIDDYGDVPAVKRERKRLLDVRERLRKGRATRDIGVVFGADSVTLPAAERIRLGFTFADDEAGAWEQGEWRSDGGGWLTRAPVRKWSDLEERWGARLILKSPLDAMEAPFDLTLRIEQLDPQAPAQLFLVSVVGFHVALVGPGLPGGGEASRWLVGDGDFEDFLERIRDPREGTREPILLVPGREHVLRITGNARRGSIDLELDGVPLGKRSGFADVDADKNSVRLWSWEPVRLIEATIEAGRRR